MIKPQIWLFHATSSPGRFPLALGGRPTQSQGKAPWGRGCVWRCGFADDGKEMDKNETRTCRVCKAVVFVHKIYKFLTLSLPSPLLQFPMASPATRSFSIVTILFCCLVTDKRFFEMIHRGSIHYTNILSPLTHDYWNLKEMRVPCRMSEIYGHPVLAATRAFRFADHVTKRDAGLWGREWCIQGRFTLLNDSLVLDSLIRSADEPTVPGREHKGSRNFNIDWWSRDQSFLETQLTITFVMRVTFVV